MKPQDLARYVDNLPPDEAKFWLAEVVKDAGIIPYLVRDAQEWCEGHPPIGLEEQEYRELALMRFKT
jgi:hypothetical protein